MPEAMLSTTGKPDAAGGPLQGCTYTGKLVYARGLAARIRVARQSGRPGDNYSIIYMETTLCWKPNTSEGPMTSIRGMSHGSHSLLETMLFSARKPDIAGGPL